MAMAIYQNDENITEGERLHTVHGNVCWYSQWGTNIEAPKSLETDHSFLGNSTKFTKSGYGRDTHAHTDHDTVSVNNQEDWKGVLAFSFIKLFGWYTEEWVSRSVILCVYMVVPCSSPLPAPLFLLGPLPKGIFLYLNCSPFCFCHAHI